MGAGILIACPSCATLNRVPPDKLGSGGKCGRCQEPLFQGRPIDMNSRNFDRHAAGADIPLLIDFWASWCGPCRQMAPIFAAAAAQLEPRMRLGKLDTEAEPSIAARFAIQGIPSLVLISKGREIARTAGAMPLSTLVDWTRTALAA